MRAVADRLLLGLVALAAPLLWVFLPVFSEHQDFRINFLAAAALLNGLDPYQPASLREMAGVLGVAIPSDGFEGLFGRYIQPPFSALLITPLVPLGLSGAWTAYYLLSLACLVGAVLLGLRLAGDRGAWRGAAACVFAWPATASLALGQVDGLITFALAVSCWALVAGRPGPAARAALAGLPVGLAAGLKVIPGIILLYFAATRRWREVVWAVAGLLCTLLAPTLVLGPAPMLAFVAQLPLLGGSSSLSDNVSLPGLLARLATGPGGYLSGEVARLTGPPAVASPLLSGALVLWSVLHARRRPAGSAYLLLLAVGLLAAPIAWGHYPTWLLPFLVAPLGRALAGPLSARSGWFLLGAGLLFFPLGNLYWFSLAPPWVATLPWGQTGLALLAGSLVARRACKPMVGSQVAGPFQTAETPRRRVF
ncbi:MAG: DUF2029 domain-containing protein [Chloroflexi bacterium]|nr:DUF2029 domain-containing protein [Chloroflexota bacterium]